MTRGVATLINRWMVTQVSAVTYTVDGFRQEQRSSIWLSETSSTLALVSQHMYMHAHVPRT